MLIGGIALGILAVILVVWHVVSKRRAGALLAAREMSIPALRGDASTLATELGGGDFEQLATLRGTVRCDLPLLSPLGERSCVYYRAEIERKYEEEHETRDSDGNVRLETRQHTETMSKQSEERDFSLADGEDSITVRVEGADHEALVETIDRFEPGGGSDDGLTIAFGQFSMQAPSIDRRRRTLGYRYQEHVLPTDGQLTVVGQVSDSGGSLTIGRGGMIFLLSTRTRSELIGRADSTARWTAIGSGVSLAVAVVCAVLHFVA